ncbi:nitrilase-related carbon-nitrogen hydrolase [uncultured Corynebacterium sp.]|uniref:nitrilase-related carbon-nitrogen hydrolase n=1 Tax=uncultured Corynebacterium sp. TaxID=159447 RepID=UPI0025E25BD5|nr:nitrilase-related carbon-nitrogen hydrolase [uncultured Corynebacterium sp.]
MRIALAQLELSPEPQENLGMVKDTIVRAAEGGADLVVFPEATMKAFNTGRLDTVAEPLDGPFATAVRAAAAEAGVTVVLGMFRPADAVERDGKELQRVYNTLLATGKGVDAHYDKIRLFDAFGFRESDTVAPGEDLVVIEVPVGDAEVRRSVRVGLATCFDVRFPEQFIELAERGAEVIVLPASWNDGPGKVRQWQALVAARALDTTCYVAAVDAARPGGAAKAGKPEGPVGVGHSVVSGPDGEPIAQAGYGPQLLLVDIDLDDLERVRKSIPVLEIRK